LVLPGKPARIKSNDSIERLSKIECNKKSPADQAAGLFVFDNAKQQRCLKTHFKGRSDHELVTVPALDPFWSLAASSPSFACTRIAVFGCDFTQNTAAATAATTAGKYIANVKPVLPYQFARFGDGTRYFSTARFFDLRGQRLLLPEKFLQIGHDFRFLSSVG
jgi:hypothetical protein